MNCCAWDSKHKIHTKYKPVLIISSMRCITGMNQPQIRVSSLLLLRPVQHDPAALCLQAVVFVLLLLRCCGPLLYAAAACCSQLHAAALLRADAPALLWTAAVCCCCGLLAAASCCAVARQLGQLIEMLAELSENNALPRRARSAASWRKRCLGKQQMTCDMEV